MEVAKSLSQEKIMHSTSLAQLLVNSQDGSHSGSSGASVDSDIQAEREAELLLEAATTLCAIAAKKVSQFWLRTTFPLRAIIRKRCH